ncbi:MAG: hypothetical protein J5594_03180 [Elusimicrobiaceae bacterium]|nr:hypothetical protein [Elusimicrobiaceae bacterium]
MDKTKNNQKNQVKQGTKAIKIFFLVFALGLLLQIVLFCRERTNYALDLITDDFKIAVVLKNANEEQAKNFSSKLYFLPEVSEVKMLNEDDIKSYLKQGNSGLNLQAFLPKGALPHFYEVKLSGTAFLNPSDWAQQYISPMSEDAMAYFQEQESAVASYLFALIKTIDIVLIGVAFALLALGFFIEVKYMPVSLTDRFYAVGSSVFAYGFAFGFMYVLLTFLKMLPLTPYDPFTLPQIGCFLFCLLFGRSLAKWGRF